MEPIEPILYYAVLVSFLPKIELDPRKQIDLGILNINKEESLQNRTFIYGSWAPLVVLRRMNDSKDPRILMAAAKACGMPVTASESMDESLGQMPVSNDIYGIMCIIGPIQGEQATEELVKTWEKLSRGSQPRTITGYNLAMFYGLNFTINFTLFFQLNPAEVRIEVDTFSMEKGTCLSVFPLVNQVTCAVPIARPVRKRPRAAISSTPSSSSKKNVTTMMPLLQVQEVQAKRRSQ